jgi:hypothetical protein
MNPCPHCGGQLLTDLYDGECCLQCGWVPAGKVDLPLVQERNGKPLSSGKGRHNGVSPVYQHQTSPKIGSVLQLTVKESRTSLIKRHNGMSRLKPGGIHYR